MDFRALREIENRHELRLPKEYCSFVLNYPTLADASKQRYLEETISRSLQTILIDNDFFRSDTEGPVQSSAFQEFGWKSSYFVVGTDGCGNYYFLDTSKSPAPVYFFDHGLETVEFLASNISGLKAHFETVCAEVDSWDD